MRQLPMRIGLLLLEIAILPGAGPAHSAAGGERAGQVMTVTGLVPPASLGLTLPHEHLLIDSRLPDEAEDTWALSGRRRPTGERALAIYRAPLAMDLLGPVALGSDNRDNWLLDSEETARRELAEFRSFGGRTLVELTPRGLGRDLAALHRLAAATGVQIVAGAGVAPPPWGAAGHGPDAAALTRELLADLLTGEGGVCAGVIGELRVLDAASERDRRLLTAAARASRASGAAIVVTPPGRGDPGAEATAILDLLAAAGADLRRVALGRAERLAKDLPRLTALLARGPYLLFDALGEWPHVNTLVSDHDVAVALRELSRAGYGAQLLVSQGVAAKIRLKAYGGGGYAFIPEQYRPYLRKLGLTEGELQALLVTNPQRLLTLAAPQGDAR